MAEEKTPDFFSQRILKVQHEKFKKNLFEFFETTLSTAPEPLFALAMVKDVFTANYGMRMDAMVEYMYDEWKKSKV